MNDNEKRSGDWKLILGGIVLIAVLFVGVKAVFYGLEQAIPRAPADAGQSTSAGQSAPEGSQGDAEAPSFCVHCGKELPDSFQWGQFCPYCGEKNEK